MTSSLAPLSIHQGMSINSTRLYALNVSNAYMYMLSTPRKLHLLDALK